MLEMTNRFSQLYGMVSSQEEFLKVSRLWWHTLEFGILKRGNDFKVYGAGHFSCKEQLLQSQNPRKRVPFELEKVIRTPGAKGGVEEKYFVIESWHQLRKATEEMKERLLA